MTIYNKKLMLAIGGLVLLIILGVSYYLLSSQKSASQNTSAVPPEIQEQVIPTISPSDLGLKLMLRSDKKALKFEIANIDDIESLDYQISYLKEINGEEVPEGLIGEIKVKPFDKKIAIDYREFGTCSSGVCRYDKVVSPVKVTLKIVKTDGKVLQAEDSIEL